MPRPVDELYAWLHEAAWPLWLDRGVDWDRGGFYEALDLHSHRCAAPFRRLRVVARQIFVFSKAHEAGLPRAADAIRIGLDFLATHAAHAEGGYAWRFDLAHRPIDATRDLYDHAFVLLAFASAASVVGRAAVEPQATELANWLARAFAHPTGGYQESLPPALPRRQNPHMHLLEALLAAHAAFGAPPFLNMARPVLALFTDRLFNPEAGALPEFFDDTLTPIRQDGIFTVEPGHHCEWAWLLHQAAALGLETHGIAQRLWSFVDQNGIGLHGALVDELGSDGRVLRAGARLWPQTERLRAEFLRPDSTAQRRLACVESLRAHVRADGLWHERRLPDGSFSDEAAPASSLYHLTGAILEARKTCF